MVSVVIPCFNAGRWVAEAIHSCLNQTYSPIEVIVIDDGSTDKSLEVIKSFGDAIRWETGPNLGANHARNRGFALSSGKYVQFLDADDYLLAGKLFSQVSRLEESGADIVYGDWRHQHHEADGGVRLEDVVCSGQQNDILAALLSGWWVAPCALLFRRGIVERVGGWDELLRAAQDTDFIISSVLAGARVVYQPGCDSIYRRYGAVTLSTSNRRRWLDSHCLVLDKALKALRAKNDFKPRYRASLARSYFAYARIYFDLDRNKYREVMAKVMALEPGFQPRESQLYTVVQHCLGFTAAEYLASWKRRLFARQSG
jgi:glycosyltransferase involved in cell wall biosynthesis